MSCKNVLVTGGCGFIASNFINYYFHRFECNIVNVDAMYYCAKEENVDKEIRESSRYKLIKGNTGNRELIDNVLRDNDITHVIHFAAQSHVQNSFDNALQYTHDNVVGTHVLLECCRLYGVEKFIHISP